jgi:hypothetical protein
VLTQVPPQFVWPELQKVTQFPFEQDWPAPQERPHWPQCALVVCTLTQLPEQEVSPLPQTHRPPEQAAPVPQTRPHWPQCRASVCKLTQRPPHRVWPVGQTQAPFWQV